MLKRKSTVNPSHGCKVRGAPDHTYCVCDDTSCAPLVKQPLADDEVNVYTSSEDGRRFDFEQIPLHRQNSDCALERESCPGTADLAAIITIHPDQTLQNIEGFGGALTDAAAESILSMPKKLQTQILDDYLGDNGLKYSMLRVPIGGSDFSRRPYALDDQEGDFQLKNFTLAPEDVTMKVSYRFFE